MNITAELQKLLNKIAVKMLMDNFSRKIYESKITHLELSRKAGKHEGAFNKTMNQMEDPNLSSFLRYWFSARSILKQRNEDSSQFSLDMLVDEKIEKILTAAADLAESDLEKFCDANHEFLIGLKVHVDLLNSKGRLRPEELGAYTEIYRELKRKENKNDV